MPSILPLAQHPSFSTPLLPISRSDTLVPANEFKKVEEDDIVWKQYEDAARVSDKTKIDEWNKFLDVILVFIALFIAVLTAFVIQTQKRFDTDPVETTNDILRNISRQLPNSPYTVKDSPQEPGGSKVILLNALLFTSLALSISIAMVAMAAKLWLIRYIGWLNEVGSSYNRAMCRQNAFSGIEAWKLHRAIDSLPLWTLVAVFLFGVFIHQILYDHHPLLGYLIGVIFLIGLTFFVVSSCSAAFISSSPFQSPFSHFIAYVHNKLFPENWKYRLHAICVLSTATAIMTTTLVAYKGSTYQLFIFFPIVGVFAVAAKPKNSDEDSPPIQLGPPALAVLGGFTVFTPIAIASYFSASKAIYISVSSVGVALLALYGYLMHKVTRRVPNMLEAEAIAWLLRSSQESSLFEKAGGVANTTQHRVLLLDTILPLLPQIIASRLRHSQSLGEHEDGQLRMLLSCLAHLLQFNESEAKWMRNIAAVKRPKLSGPLRDQLEKLRADPRYSDAAEAIWHQFRNEGERAVGRV